MDVGSDSHSCILGVGAVGADCSHLSASLERLLGLRELFAQGHAGLPRVSDQLMWGFKGLTPLLHSETNMKGHSSPGAPRGCWDIVDTAAWHLPLSSSALFPSFLPCWTLVPIHVPTNPLAAYIPSLCLLLGNPNREHHRVRKQSTSDAAQGSWEPFEDVHLHISLRGASEPARVSQARKNTGVSTLAPGMGREYSIGFTGVAQLVCIKSHKHTSQTFTPVTCEQTLCSNLEGPERCPKGQCALELETFSS